MEAINNSNWHDSAIYTMTALVICLENSFWRDSQNFQTAFKESWNFYIHSDARKRVEQELSAAMPVEFQIALRAWRGRPNLTEGQKKEFSEIVCRNLLPRPDTQLSV
ncbi:hypothetical protein FA15DRAFT_673259 [Coprinopsis marcescibilis]|uniref:Uncharacterized protein n=1 Tax=Coprinopsis marcescibilis TaxID=230819 RepID=A0A5C3KXK2_COPMA|nr:hypothetical protein FA15DRAFT_673259 [Coprinopsis marcescibilis]